MAYTTIDNPELYFQVKTYTGNGTDDTSITLDGDENMQPDLVWLKRRDNAGRHRLFDSVRTATKWLRVDDTDAEGTAADSLKSFDSDGFTLGADSASGGINVNINNETMVAWCWKESADAGFDMVTYTGNQTARTISHSLSAVPHWMVIKNRGSTYSWQVYHHKNTSAPETEIMYLNQTAATSDSNVEWNDTAPTSSVFTVGTDVGVNQTSQSHIAYLWSEKQGFSKFGSYDSNSNADGPYVYLGFRPAYLMIKCTTASEHWTVFDNKREPTNDGVMSQLNASGSTAEGTLNILFLSNGFKVLEVTGQTNKSGSHSYVYMAFAEQPFVNSKGVPCNAR